ncbi:hypothetical protein [Bergeyella sp. RCAD1439]|uniref:hypothetical protein n=1 Tax=Bergeyella anatis TaxID=3113737 RepID=UPI002E194CE7|nr:hypothetical protein [Bergeyella sp. RCAD1439]
MKIKFLILFLILLFNASFSQKLIFSGYVDSDFTSDTIYYSIDKMEFSKENFITLNKYKYKLELDLKKHKKSKYLFFSNSLWNYDTPDRKENCVHRYDLKGILKHFNDRTSDINIENDVIKRFECGIRKEPFSLPENKKFEGKYEFTVNGEKRNTEINSLFVESTLETINNKLMTNEISNWKYFPNEKILEFSRVKQYNPILGLELMITDIYRFDVEEKDGFLLFKSKTGDYQLKKL